MRRSFCGRLVLLLTATTTLWAYDGFLAEQDAQTFLRILQAHEITPESNHFTDINCTILSIPMIHRQSAQCRLLDHVTRHEITLWKSEEVFALINILKSAGATKVALHPERIGDSSFTLHANSIDCLPLGQCRISL